MFLVSFSFLALFLCLVVADAGKVPIRLEIQLDERPSDTAWQLIDARTATVLTERSYDYYQEPEAKVTEVFELDEKHEYYLILLDYERNGLDGYFAVFAEEQLGDSLLLSGNGRFWESVLHTFRVGSAATVKEDESYSTFGSFFRSLFRVESELDLELAGDVAK